jgi:GNAT superfamily N-acetyltransferase
MFYTNTRSPVKLRAPLVTGLEIHVATSERWADLAELFERRGPRGGTPQTDGCWCQFWHLRGKDYSRNHGEPSRRRLEQEVRGGDEPGLLAYVDGTAVGWCRVGPRESFERLEHAPRLARVDDEPVWSVVCFYVHPTAKRRGVASALLDSALEHAAGHCAPIVEAYPVREGHMNVDAYTGYLPMFLAAGFEQVRDAGRRVVVRRRLL